MIRPAIPAIAAAAVAMSVPAAGQTMPELSYGVAVTSNYISDGATQSDDNPALQGYVEGAYGMFYGGVWSSTVDFDDGNNFEFDLYAGVRPSFGDLSVDFGYYRYLYDDSGDCCGEFVLIFGYPMADLGEVGLEFDYDPENDTQWLEAASFISVFTDFLVGGTVGTDLGTEDWGDDDKVAWDLGISRGLGDLATVDLRYYDSNYDPARGVLSISLDF